MSLGKKIIAPSILAADFAKLGDEISAVTSAGADWIHVDVMDGHFVPNLTIGMPVVAALKKISKIPLDVHLMIESPEKYVDDFIGAGADVLTIHVEATKDPEHVLKHIKNKSVRAGISLRPGTPLSAIESLLPFADLVLVMTVEPGFGGQSFMHDQVAKIEALSKIRKEKNLSFLIEVDGGVTDQTTKYLSQADVLVAGSFIFQKPGTEAVYKAQIESLRF
jgi:ribulose-phosphate 3-epimerase